MAPTYVGVSANAAYTTDGTLDALLPVGTAEDDLLLLPIAVRLAAATIDLSTPDYELISGDNESLATALTTEVQSKIAGPSEGNAAVSSSATATQPTGAVIVAVRGAGAVEDVVIAMDDGGSQLASAPAATALVDDCLVVRVFVHGGPNTVDVEPAGHTQRFFESTALGSDLLIAVYTQDAAANTGAVAAAVLDLNASDPWQCYTIIIPPAAGGGAETATLTAVLPALTGALTAAASSTATVTGALPAMTGSLTAHPIADATIAANLPALTGSIAASVAGVESAVLAAALPALTGSLTADAKASATLAGTLPALAASLTAGEPSGSVVVRPFTGTVGRPAAGTVTRPFTGTVTRP